MEPPKFPTTPTPKVGYRSDHCSGENCGRDFSYGMMAVRGGSPPKIYCQRCANKHKISGPAVIYGGGDPSKVSAVSRDRAQRKLKKLDRINRRLKKERGEG